MAERGAKMLREIREQPEAVARTLEAESGQAAKIGQLLRDSAIELVIIAARGSSDNAAQYGKYLFEYINQVPVSLAAPSLYTLYKGKVRLPRTLVIGISQSGESPDVVEVLQNSAASGAVTVAITNNAASPLSRAADYIIQCRAGMEESVAATKTYLTQLTSLALLSFAWADRPDRLRTLQKVPDLLAKIINEEEQITDTVSRYRYMKECAVIGRGFNYATALEAALKLKETSYVGAQAYSSADFLHGPIAMVAEGFPVFLIAPPGAALDSVQKLHAKLVRQKAETIILSSSPEALESATVPLRVPVEVDEVLTPLLYPIPMQLFSCHLAREKGYDPDAPRGLRKVTLTH